MNLSNFTLRKSIDMHSVNYSESISCFREQPVSSSILNSPHSFIFKVFFFAFTNPISIWKNRVNLCFVQIYACVCVSQSQMQTKDRNSLSKQIVLQSHTNDDGGYECWAIWCDDEQSGGEQWASNVSRQMNDC